MKKVENGWRDVNEARGQRCRPLDAGWNDSSGGPMDNERDVQRALVDEIAVALLTVVTKALAMVGDQHHQRFVPPSGLLQGSP